MQNNIQSKKKMVLPRTVNKPRAWKLHCYFTHLVSRNSIRMRRNYCCRLWLFFYLAAAMISPTHVARLEWRWAGRVGQDIRCNVRERNCMALPHHSLSLCWNNIFFIFAKPTLFRTCHFIFFSSKEPDYNVAELWTLGLIAKNNDKFNIRVAPFLTDYW